MNDLRDRVTDWIDRWEKRSGEFLEENAGRADESRRLAERQRQLTKEFFATYPRLAAACHGISLAVALAVLWIVLSAASGNPVGVFGLLFVASFGRTLPRILREIVRGARSG